jgi:hypothetical protein
MVRQFLASGDSPPRNQEYPAAPIDGIAVGPARVICIASGIVTRTAIDIEARTHIENIAVVSLVADARRYSLAGIFDDCVVPLKINCRKKTKPGACPFYTYALWLIPMGRHIQTGWVNTRSLTRQ